jgi:glutamate 5-kinase
VVDDGARVALVEKKKSLLPVRACAEVKGTSSRTATRSTSRHLKAVKPFARGLAAYGAEELRRLAGKKTAQIEATLGYRGLDEAVHRDDLAMLVEQ